MARIKSARSAGAPGIKRNRMNWPRITKPMRRIRSVRTLRKVDEAVGNTMPESKNLLQRPGVGTRQQSPRVVGRMPIPAPGANKTKVKTPRPAAGGIRSPFRRGRGS